MIYKVLAVELTDNGLVTIPENAIVAGPITDPRTGKWNIAYLIPFIPTSEKQEVPGNEGSTVTKRD